MSNDFKQLHKQVDELKNQGKSIGLITGCFDVLHIGHIRLFKKAKEIVDVLVVAIENDETISISKKNRPINRVEARKEFLKEIDSIDFVVIIDDVWCFNDPIVGDLVHKKLIKKLKPDYIFTNKQTDKYWAEKKKRAKEMHIKFCELSSPEAGLISTSKIADMLVKEGI